jgi:hypothetical protein
LPDWDGDWIVEWDCDFPNGNYKVYWDIIVWNYTVTIPIWITLWIDLTTNKITFWNWKILFGTNAKIDNSVSTRYDFSVNYIETPAGTVIPITTHDTPITSWVPITNCPTWTQVLNLSRTWFAWTSPLWVAASGTMYCAKP